MRIGDVLSAKSSREVVTISPDAGVRELLALLSEHNVGALIVSSDGERLEGIVSERDVVRRLHADGTVLNNTVGAIRDDSPNSTRRGRLSSPPRSTLGLVRSAIDGCSAAAPQSE